jgi:hypothetical protein
MLKPFTETPLDGFQYLTNLYPAAMNPQRRWLANNRVNALRQSTLYHFRAEVVNIIPVPNQVSYSGQVRVTPKSWLYGVGPQTTTASRFWTSDDAPLSQGITVNGPLQFSTLRNGNQPEFVALLEPWFLKDGIINWETHNVNGTTGPMVFYLCVPDPDVSGEVIDFCKEVNF